MKTGSIYREPGQSVVMLTTPRCLWSVQKHELLLAPVSGFVLWLVIFLLW